MIGLYILYIYLMGVLSTFLSIVYLDDMGIKTFREFDSTDARDMLRVLMWSWIAFVVAWWLFFIDNDKRD